MSNFSIFNKAELALLVNPFLPGAVDHITPIKYQAITPDIFALLFRTTGPDGVNHYFVALEYDYMEDLQAAGQLIEEWSSGTIKTFLLPEEADEVEEAQLKDLQAITNEPYFAVLATIERPRDMGYWSDNIVIMPGEPLAEKLDGLSSKQLEIVYKFINAQTDGQPSGTPKTNTTTYAMSVWPKNGGGVELFFN